MNISVMVCCSDTKRRNKITSLLQQMGSTVVAEASDAPQALRQVHTLHPQLVIIDIEFYDPSSLEIASLISREKLAPVILLTTPHHQEVIRALNENYIMSYVVKPINKWALESTVYTVLANFRKMEQMESEINKLKDTLETRKVVEKAKHILMRDQKLTEPEAFRRMQKQSMDKGIAMKSLAEAIILNEELKNPS